MLNMLNMLRRFWGELEGDPLAREFTYSTFQQKEAHFRINVVLFRGNVESKCASFRRNVEYVEYVENVLGGIRR